MAWALWVAYIGILELVWFVGVFLYSFEIESAIKLSGAIGTFIIVKVKSLLCLFDRFRKQLGARGLMSTPNLNRWIKYDGYYSCLYSLHTRYTARQKPLCCVIRDLGSVDASLYVGTSISPVVGWNWGTSISPVAGWNWKLYANCYFGKILVVKFQIGLEFIWREDPYSY